jgi:L,D-transpeptidase catalytic domain
MIRWLKWLPLVLVIVFGATGGSLWAHQVIAESTAHSSFISASHALRQGIVAARQDGLLPSEAQPYSDRWKVLTAASPPHEGTFWSGTTAGFYSHESAQLKELARQLSSQVRQMTANARSQVKHLLWKIANSYRISTDNGLNPARFYRKLTTDRLNFARSSTVGQYRELVGAVQPQLAALHVLVGRRLTDMAHILRRAHASRHAFREVHREIEARLGAAKNDLGLLDLFGKYSGLTRQLTRVSTWALRRTHLHKAAIAAADVGAIAAQIHARLVKVAPAKWIFVSTENETIAWYQGPSQIGFSLATTGNPALPTVTGHFKIIYKSSPFQFVSQDPIGSAFYYPPSWVSYAMEFQSAGYYIHDAPWRSVFGPGTDGPGTPGTNYGGSHGCVNVPYDVAQFLYGWAPEGTTVIVV